MEELLIYRARFSPLELNEKRKLWSVLCSSFLQRFVPSDGTVVDVGAGSCEFINNIQCARKWAVDINPDTAIHAAPGVEIRPDLAAIETGSADVVFCSNFFEHLTSKELMVRVLKEILRILSENGRLIVIQPNIRYAFREYWDYFDHFLPLSHLSMREVLEALGFKIEVLRPSFLPYTVKSRLPKWPFLLRLYLSLTPLHRIFGKQMFIVASKAPRI